MKAAQRGHVHTVRRLQEAGAHINLKDNDGDSALMLAVVKNKVHVVKALLAMRTQINDVDNHGDTALMVASQQGRIATVQLLLDAKADVNTVNSMGWTSLMITAMNNRVATVRALLDAGADTSPRCFEARKDALDYARDFECKGVIQILEDEEEDEMQNGNARVAHTFEVISPENNPPEPETKTQLVLFSDGACKKNPGQGAAGWVLVEVHPHKSAHRILYIGSVLLADRTTNNITEYRALMYGLKATLTHDYRDIHVVSDSLNIVRQMIKGSEPPTEHLQKHFHESRSYAKQIGVRSWKHHGRDYNAMADTAANWAVRTQSSLELKDPDTRDGLGRAVESHLENDVNEWLRVKHAHE